MAKQEMPWSRKLDPWKDLFQKFEGMSHTRTTSSMVERGEELYTNVGRFIDEINQMGPTAFERRWAHIRSFIPLQVRLVAEQIFWERGGSWRRYITGFKPVVVGRSDLQTKRY